MNQSLHDILLRAHSIGRWLLLLILLIAIFRNAAAGRRPFTSGDARTGLMLTIVADLMLLLGLVLYFAGPLGYHSLAGYNGGMGAAMQDPIARFYGVEHITGMLIAIVLMHIGKAQGKKVMSDRKKHTRSAVFYVLALLIILATIPWPFTQAGAGRAWF